MRCTAVAPQYGLALFRFVQDNRGVFGEDMQQAVKKHEKQTGGKAAPVEADDEDDEEEDADEEGDEGDDTEADAGALLLGYRPAACCPAASQPDSHPPIRPRTHVSPPLPLSARSRGPEQQQGRRRHGPGLAGAGDRAQHLRG